MRAELDPGPQVQLLGRVKPGIAVKAAQAEMAVLAKQFAQADSKADKTIAVTLPRATFFVGTDDIRFQASAAILMAVVGMVLLIAYTNLANMSMARTAGRHTEIGVRLALGASRGRLIRQLLTESMLLAVLGGGAARRSPSGRAGSKPCRTIDRDVFWECGAGHSHESRHSSIQLCGAGLTGDRNRFRPAAGTRFSKPEFSTALKEEGSGLDQR